MAKTDDRLQSVPELTRAAGAQISHKGEGDLVVAALQAGDRDTLTLCYSAYYREMVNQAMIYVHSRAAAEEVVQDTWTAVIESLPTFKGHCSIKTWVFRILVKKATRSWRRESRLAAIKRVLSPGVGGAPFDSAGSWASPPKRWSQTPEELLLLGEFRREFQTFVASLPSRQRQVFIATEIEGDPLEKICELLGITAGNGRILLHRARVAIHRWYASRIQGGAENIASSPKGFTS